MTKHPVARSIEFSALALAAAPMPDGSGPVELAALPDVGDGAFRAFVRFPAGWSRVVTGHYPVIEEVLVLEGDLVLDSARWGAGGYGWVPAHATRGRLVSSAGALVLAWFGAPPRWRRGASPEIARDTTRWLGHWAQARRAARLGDPAASVLNDARGHEAWVTTLAQSFAAPAPLECLDLETQSWRFLGAGEQCVLEGRPTFVRAHATT